MAANRVVAIFLFYFGLILSSDSYASCDTQAYRQLFAACLTGRADSALYLPRNEEESQAQNSSGIIDSGKCCSPNLSLFTSGTTQDYQDAFGSCDQLLTLGNHPHTYDVTTFRKERRTGEMDMRDGYDRQAGVKACARSGGDFRKPCRDHPKLSSALTAVPVQPGC